MADWWLYRTPIIIISPRGAAAYSAASRATQQAAKVRRWPTKNEFCIIWPTANYKGGLPPPTKLIFCRVGRRSRCGRLSAGGRPADNSDRRERDVQLSIARLRAGGNVKNCRDKPDNLLPFLCGLWPLLIGRRWPPDNNIIIRSCNGDHCML